MGNDNQTMDTSRPTRLRNRAWAKIPLAGNRGFRAVGVGLMGLTKVKRTSALMVTLLCLFCLSRQSQGGGEPPVKEGPVARPDGLTLVRRSVSQDQGAWVIDYQLRHAGSTGLILMPSDVAVTIEGWVSNSRVCSHAVPRLARVTVSGTSAGTGTGDVITSTEESNRCREKVVVSIWAEDGPLPENEAVSLISLAPGGIARVRLRIEHQHVLYGDYDPLLGVQDVELRLGSATLRDRVPLDREHYLAQPKFVWPEPPEERRDTRHFVSSPDSLHLEAHIPGHQYYRYPERPVRYGSKMWLRFWYLIAAGTEGECRIRLAQYKDTPTSWRVLSGGGFEQDLETVGRWTKVERIVRAECEATTVALDFRIISETNIGEMWIDDVSLEPLGCEANREKP
jgi:hypothetical protein